MKVLGALAIIGTSYILHFLLTFVNEISLNRDYRNPKNTLRYKVTSVLLTACLYLVVLLNFVLVIPIAMLGIESFLNNKMLKRCEREWRDELMQEWSKRSCLTIKGETYIKKGA